MAWAEVASQRITRLSDDLGSDAVAFPGNVTSGNLLLVVGATYHASGTASISVTDTRSTAYTVVLGTQVGGTHRTFLAYGLAPSSGACTVTVDPAGTNSYFSWALDEFSGAANPVPDVDGGSSTGTGTAASDSVTTGVADALVVGVTAQATGGNVLITPGGSYTQIGESEDAGNHMTFNGVFRIVTTAQAYTVDWTWGSSISWIAQTHSFKPAVAGGRTTKNTRGFPLGMEIGMGWRMAV